MWVSIVAVSRYHLINKINRLPKHPLPSTTDHQCGKRSGMFEFVITKGDGNAKHQQKPSGASVEQMKPNGFIHSTW